MVNPVNGKTVENLRKRINVKVVNNEKDYLKTSANQFLFLQKSLLKFKLPFMKLNQF